MRLLTLGVAPSAMQCAMCGWRFVQSLMTPLTRNDSFDFVVIYARRQQLCTGATMQSIQVLAAMTTAERFSACDNAYQLDARKAVSHRDKTL